jgi:hypothetical protein
MKERGWIEPIVERVVGQVLDSHAAQLRTEIVRRVMEEIAAAPATAEATSGSTSSDAASASGPADLAHAVAEIQLGASQREILRALLDTSAHHAARVALFVVKGSHATGWQARGFANSDAVKDFALDENAPAVAHAIRDRVAASAPVADLDSRFLKEFGTPASGEARILPLMLKDKVAALVYADSGTDAAGLLNAGAIELLVLSTSAWLEVNSLRKQAQKEPSAAHADSSHGDSHSVPAAESPAHQAAVHAVSAYNDPFASHAPGHGKAAAASAGQQSASVASAAFAAPAMAEPLPIGDAETKATLETPPVSSISPEDQDVHHKAQRFARLLIDEIKLYNQAKVAEGRKHKDLYDRLKETIEKSRATYQKRYGKTIAASGNYLQNEVIRSLAEDDPSIMGANFRY